MKTEMIVAMEVGGREQFWRQEIARSMDELGDMLVKRDYHKANLIADRISYYSRHVRDFLES